MKREIEHGKFLEQTAHATQALFGIERFGYL
jgi:hypothetical protein